jgi:hypothetical protein
VESRLVRILQQSVTEFHQKTLSEIKDGDRTIPRPTENRKIPVGAISLQRILNQIFPQNILDLKEIFLSHFNEIRSLIPLSSSPRAFRTAWDLRSEILNPYDADVIVNQGGQFIPLNTKSRVFRCEQQGVLYGPNKRFVLGIRHVEGNYEDQLDDLGRFTYQPPENVAGMLRYRFCEYLANKMPIPYILIAIMWFEHRINKDLTHVFVIAPCKVIEYEANLKDLN